MYTVSHYQGYNAPLDQELLESFEGEAKEIILQSFIDEGMFTDTVYTLDDVEENDIEIEVKDYMTAYEIAALKDIETNAAESFWDAMTVQSLSDVIKESTELKEAA